MPAMREIPEKTGRLRTGSGPCSSGATFSRSASRSTLELLGTSRLLVVWFASGAAPTARKPTRSSKIGPRSSEIAAYMACGKELTAER
eukprot:scaffold112272_cov32-Tisochrysis_lutea.AAC.7